MDSHKPAVSKALLKTSGSQSMSADELISIVKGQDRPIFWLGRLSGDTYSENSTVSSVDVITYLPENATAHTTRQLDLVIKTSRNSTIFNVQLHPLSGTAETTVGGGTVIYNPAFQRISTLVMDGQNLDSIR